MPDMFPMDRGVPRCVFVTVVRDHELYRRLVSGNSNNAGGEFVAFDNLVENMSVTRRYKYSRDFRMRLRVFGVPLKFKVRY